MTVVCQYDHCYALEGMVGSGELMGRRFDGDSRDFLDRCVYKCMLLMCSPGNCIVYRLGIVRGKWCLAFAV